MIEENKPLEAKLNDMLGDAYDKAQIVEEKIEKEEKQEVKEETPKKEARPRAKDGKFAKEEAKEEKAVETETAPEETTDQSVSVSDVVAPVSKAPDHWSAGAKAVWDKLDPVVRAEALKQVEFANKLQSRHAQERKKYEAIDAVLEPQRNMLRASYGDEVHGLKNLFALSDFASKDPRGFVQWFAQQRGIDLRGLTQNVQQNAVDPTIRALEQQLKQAVDRINGFEQNQKQTIYSDVDKTFREFAANPENKYLEEVKDDMAFLLEAGRASDWQTAYNLAVKLNPAVSELVEAEKLAAIQEKKQKEAEEAANRAKKAKEINVKTNGVVRTSESKGSWTDTLNQTADRLLGA